LVQADDAITLPLPLGIVTVFVNVLPWKDTWPASVVGMPPAGVNTTFQVGSFHPPLPSPDEANAVQWKVTVLQVAVTLTVCACALAAKIANDRKTSTTTLRTRGTITAPRPKRVAAGVGLWAIMLELLRAGVLSLWPVAEFSVTPRHGDGRKEMSCRWVVAELGESAIDLQARTSSGRLVVAFTPHRPSLGAGREHTHQGSGRVRV
jgi:hypothetical protein